MKPNGYNINANLVHTIEQLCDKATSAVQMNNSTGEWFKTKAEVRHGCVLQQIMTDALKEHDRKASIGGKNITSLLFADDIDSPA